MKLCINCKYYEAKEKESADICTHPKAFKGGVRTSTYHACQPMLAGICEKNQLFEPATLPQLVQEAQK